MENVAIYIRVSTTKQELKNQEGQLISYVNSSGWNIYKIYSDVISGKEEKRPAYDELFKDAHQKKFDIVLFWALDRFSRSGTLFTLQKLKELDNLGIKWHSYQEPYFSSIGEFKDVVISIMATLAKIERQRISERTKAGMDRSDKKPGRPSHPRYMIEKAKELLSQGLTYKQMKHQLKYKDKNENWRTVSEGFVSLIRKKKIL